MSSNQVEIQFFFRISKQSFSFSVEVSQAILVVSIDNLLVFVAV